MRIVIHIGVHKTGTTAIQTLLSRNTELLNEFGFYYAPTLPGVWPNHNPLVTAFWQSEPPGVGEGCLADLLARAEGRTVLISSEMLCETDLDIERFMSCFGGHDVEVIAYIRHPCDILNAAYDEVVRCHSHHWTRSINERPLVYDPGQIDGLNMWLYRDDIKLTLSPYDPKQWPDGSIYLDFLDLLKVPSTGFDTILGRVNESLPLGSAEKLRALNATNPTLEQHTAMVEELRRQGSQSDTYPLTAETVKLCLQRMEEGLPRLRPHFRPGFCEDFLLEKRP